MTSGRTRTRRAKARYEASIAQDLGYLEGRTIAATESDNPYTDDDRNKAAWRKGFAKGRASIVIIHGRAYEKFIRWPRPVNDGTVRCIACGQIDEAEYHEDRFCSLTRAIETTGKVAA